LKFRIQNWGLTPQLLFLAIALAASPHATSGASISSPTRQEGAGEVIEGVVCGPTATLIVGFDGSAGQVVASAETVGPDMEPCARGNHRRRFTMVLDDKTLFRYGGLAIFARGVDLAADSDGPVEAWTLPEWLPTPVEAKENVCEVKDFKGLSNCLSQIRKYSTVRLVADIQCLSLSECCPEGQHASIHLQGIDRKVLDGAGHTIVRRAGQALCSAIWSQHVTNVLIRNLLLDEDRGVPPCELSVKNCAPTLRIDNSQNVRVSGARIYAGKGYVVRVWNSDGFVLVNSVVADAGIIGLYVGHFKLGPTRNVVIANNIFAHSRTNAVALQGVTGVTSAPALVLGNTFTNNHWHGLWPVAGQDAGITTGGQLLVAAGENIRIVGNVIADGRCENCNPPRGVTAIELSETGVAPDGVAGIAIDHNQFLNGADKAIYQNPRSRLERIDISENRATGFAVMQKVEAPFVERKNEVVGRAVGFGPAINYAASGRQLGNAPRPGVDPRPRLKCVSGKVAVGQCGKGDGVDVVLGYPEVEEK